MKWFKFPLVCLATASLATTSIPGTFLAGRGLQPGSCHVTTPNGIVAGSADRNETSYGNALLSVGPFGLWPNGTVVFKPGGTGFRTADGWLGMKFGWTRAVPGKLNVTGRRIDAEAPPLRLETNQTSDARKKGFLASYLIFPTAGCWEVSAQVGDRLDSKITFVTLVQKVGDGPAQRR
jgi:hypothetical protein